MSEAAPGQNHIELEGKMEDTNEKEDDLFYMEDENGKKQLIEIDKVKDFNEKCHKTTNFESLMHLLKVSIGTGILGLPVAVMNAGIAREGSKKDRFNQFVPLMHEKLIKELDAIVFLGLLYGSVGPISLFVAAIIAMHCMLILVESARELSKLSKRSSLDYGEAAEECVRMVAPSYARVGRYTVNVILCITQVGVCTVYILFAAKNVEQVLEQLHVVNLPVEVWILIMCPLLMLFSMIRSLSTLAYLSTCANILMAFAILSIFSYLIPNTGNPSKLPMFAGWSVFPLFFGVAVFAFEAIPVVLPLENQMREPQHFPNVVKCGMTIVMVIYICMGTLGYLTCKENCEGSITLNLPGTVFYSIVKLAVAIAVFFSYFIQAYVPLKIIEPWVFENIPEKLHFVTDMAFRVLLAVLACGLAAAVPQLHNVISLVGALSMSLLGFAFPVAIHSITFYNELSWTVHAKNIFIFLFGVLGCLAGTYTAIYHIVKTMQEPEKS